MGTKPEPTSGSPEQSSKQTPPPTESDKSGRDRGWWWLLGVVLVIEFVLFGYRGEIQVCVGKEGVHDFDNLGQPRTDENRWAFPRCEKRLNLGLLSDYDVAVEGATEAACRGATTVQLRDENKTCVAGERGWEHRIETTFVPPWDSRYLQEMFWFLYR